MRLPPMPPRSPKHTEERLKLLANILQNFALALFFSILIAPQLNPALTASLGLRLLAIFLSGVAVALAFLLLRYTCAPSVGAAPMADLIGNLFLYLAVAGIGAGATYGLWRLIAGGP